jgi:hypothetical protein
MSGRSPSSPQQPPPKVRGLTAVQIGAAVGAALTALFLFALRELSPQGGAGSISNVLIGVLAGVGAILGMAVVSLVNFIRHRKAKENVQDGVGGDKTDAPLHAAQVPKAEAEGNGNPILRVVAGVLAVLFAGGAVDNRAGRE